MIEQLIFKIQTLEPSFILRFFIILAAAVASFIIIKRLRPSWKIIPFIIFAIIIVRLLLFDNPLAWLFYKNFLTRDDLGNRERGVIKYEYAKYFRSPQKTKYLAVGSSQTFCIFGHYSLINSDLKIFDLSGSRPLDLILYKNHIKSFKPDHILLYLSELDLAFKPELVRAIICPHQGLSLLKIYPMLREMMISTNSEFSLIEVLASEIFPEYKYSFIFKGIINKITRKNKALEIQEVAEISNDASLGNYLNVRKTKLDEKWINFHVSALEIFLKFCKKQSLNVIIVEGQYNPLAYTDKALALNRIVHEKLLNLANQYTNVEFIPRSAVFEFSANDYWDGSHVKFEQAYPFAVKLIRTIEKNNE